MKNLLKKVLSVAAATALLMTSVISASAADGHAHRTTDTPITVSGDAEYTITLTKPDGVTVEASASYGAYQIFTGTVPEELDPSKGTISGDDYLNPGSQGADNDTSTRAALPITDIKWGNAFGEPNLPTTQANIVNFVKALADPYLGPDNEFQSAFANFDDFEDFVNGVNLADRFYKVSDNYDNSNVNFDKLATEVADIIAEHNDREWLQAFTDILGGYGENYGTSKNANKGFVTQYYAGEWKSDNFEIGVPESGYYMILDQTDVEKANESYSARMLFVVNNVTQVLKEDAPKLTKKISRDDGTDNYKYETDAAAVGDEVDFRLTGTLPSNYAQYTLGYQFKFVDTLSKGLTLKGTEKTVSGNKSLESYNDTSLTITVVGALVDGVWDPDAKFTLAKADFDPDPLHSHTDGATEAYTATYEEKESQQILTVYFPCLREIKHIDSGKTYTLGYDVESTKGSVIYVDYTAIVNKDAIVGNGANTNSATLTYSDNPQSYTDVESTTPDTAKVYTFGLDILKYDAGEFLRNGAYEAAAINGAQFVVTRADTNGNDKEEIAVFTLIETDGNGLTAPYYQLQGWQDVVDDTPYNDDSYKGGIVNITSLDAPNKGKILISGLDVGVEYTFTETKAPGKTGDYATIKPFTVTLTGVTEEIGGNDEYNGKISAAETDKDAAKNLSIDEYVTILDPTDPTKPVDGTADIAVANFKYTDLPSTGGIGVYIYYIAGGCIVALAVVLFALSKKKKTTK